MAVNSKFNILEPEAWTEVARELHYPMKPMMARAATSVAGANLEGYVANAFDTVKVPRPVRAAESEVADYNPNVDPTPTDPDVNEAILNINKHEISAFRINKRDFKFTLIDLVRMYMPTYLDVHARKINANLKAEARKFEAVFADLDGTSATVLDDADLREARRIMLGRKFINSSNGFISVIDPDAEADLTGLSLFHQADQYGARNVLLEGSMGRAMGFDFYVDNLGSTHTSANVGTGASTAATSGAATAGDTSLTITVGNSALVDGDVIYFDGASSPDDFYVVDNVDGTTLTLKEPLRKNVATAKSIKAVAGTSLKEEFFYNPDAIAMVTAGMESIPNTENVGIRRAIGFDPTNNMNYTLSMRPTIHGVDVFIETLYGLKLFYPDHGARYVKGTNDKV